MIRKIILILFVFSILSPMFASENIDEKQEIKRVAIGLNLSHTLILGYFSEKSESCYIPIHIDMHYSIKNNWGIAGTLFYRYEDGFAFTQEIGVCVGPRFSLKKNNILSSFAAIKIGLGYTWGHDYIDESYSRLDFVLQPECGYLILLSDELFLSFGLGIQSLIPLLEGTNKLKWSDLGVISHYYLPVVSIVFGIIQ
ncbi:MAG: hypothetical protein OQK82_07495 [Candidatus Pacearchaeota archaeon]|nr:hypothetical protein [Candidatus Pacearchaeota archaeon]